MKLRVTFIILTFLLATHRSFAWAYDLDHDERVSYHVRTTKTYTDETPPEVSEEVWHFLARKYGNGFRVYLVKQLMDGSFSKDPAVYFDFDHAFRPYVNLSAEKSRTNPLDIFPKLPNGLFESSYQSWDPFQLATVNHTVTERYLRRIQFATCASNLYYSKAGIKVCGYYEFSGWEDLISWGHTEKSYNDSYRIKQEFIIHSRGKACEIGGCWMQRDLETFFATQRSVSEAISTSYKSKEKSATLLLEAEKQIDQSLSLTETEIVKVYYESLQADIAQAKQAATKWQSFYKLLGEKAPHWEGPTFDGKHIDSKDLEGNIVILDFWFATCSHCLKMIPELNKVAYYYRNISDVKFIGVNVDTPMEKGKQITDEAQVIYPNINSRKTAIKFGVRAYPTLMVLDRKGIVREVELGSKLSFYTDLIREIEALRFPKKH